MTRYVRAHDEVYRFTPIKPEPGPIVRRLRTARNAYLLARGFGRGRIFSYLMWVRMLITGRTRYRIY